MESKDVLILVKTYPEYSSKYVETVCTAGILKDTKKLIRLYPIRYRYLEGNNQFSKYQWINVRISKPTLDTRPESYTIEPDSIKIGSKMASKGNWIEREEWVLNNNNLFGSVEELWDAQQSSGTSLGIVKLKKIIKFDISPKSESDIMLASEKKEKIMKQLGMFEDKKDLEILPVRFVLHFVCDGSNCKEHKMSILDWEFGQLYRKLKNNAAWKSKIENKISEICGSKKNTYLILGNTAKWRNTFCILGFFYPPIRLRQLSLF